MDYNEVREMSENFAARMFEGQGGTMSEARAANIARWAVIAAKAITEALPTAEPGNVPPERGPDWKHLDQ